MAFQVPAWEQTKLPVINRLQNLFGHAEITGAEDKKDPRRFLLLQLQLLRVPAMQDGSSQCFSSWNHRMARVEKDHNDHLLSTPLGHPQPPWGNLFQCVTVLCVKNFLQVPSRSVQALQTGELTFSSLVSERRKSSDLCKPGVCVYS